MKKNINFFISYSRKDKKYVFSLIETIIPFLNLYCKELDINFWTDEKGIYPNGESIKDKIVDVIQEEIDFGLLFYSENFLDSKFIREIEYPEFYKKNNIIRAYIFNVDDFQGYDEYFFPTNVYVFEHNGKGFAECKGIIQKREYCKKLAEKIKFIVTEKQTIYNQENYYYQERQMRENLKLIEEIKLKINFISENAKELFEQCIDCEKEEISNQFQSIFREKK